jgi:hypothetical protein
MKFIENLYGGSLINVAEIVSIYKVGCYNTYFPYRHTFNNVKGIGVYAALKIGQNCHSLPVVTMNDITSLADFDLSGSELERYLHLLQTEAEQYSLVTEIFDELMCRIQKPTVFVDTWDVVLTCIRRRNEKLSEQDCD